MNDDRHDLYYVQDILGSAPSVLLQVLLLNANNKRNNCYQNCMKLYMRTNIKNKQRTPLLRDGRPF